jgi:poly-gamma-glutamate capsule biosynthesis protein CapA/YwtB (metallophosphatase superfamily)
LKILFVGDVMLGRLVNELLKRELPAYPWGDTLSIFKKADLRICNLECVISDRGQPWSITPKVFHFRSDAKNIETLESAGIDAVSLANNHTLDFEYEGMFEMLRILSDAGIYHAGAGADFEEASRPSLFEVSGKKIAFISFTDNEPEWEATPEKPGIFYVPTDLEDDRAKRLFEIIHQTRNEVDFLIVSAHWGPNWGNRPREDQLPFGHRLIDSGTDIVFGHSCHVFQGIEIYRGRPILYSTGDFIDDYAVDEMDRNDESFIFLIETSDDKTFRLWLYPTLINDSQARLAGRNEARKIATKMVTLCKELNTVAIWHGKEGVLEISGRGLG